MLLLSNLSPAPVATEGFPWEWKYPSQVPEVYIKNKAERAKWASDPLTSHCMYGKCRGVNPAARVANHNPPAAIEALACDYDDRHSAEDLIALAGSEKFRVLPPTAISISLSGRTHVIWLLEAPFPISGMKHTGEFLSFLQKELRLSKKLDNLEGFSDPGKYLTASGNWVFVCKENRIPSVTIQGLYYKFLEKAKHFDVDSEVAEESQVDLRDVEQECERRSNLDPSDPLYMPNWKFRETLGKPLAAKQVMRRFWVPGADDPKGAMIFPWGVWSLIPTPHAVPWSEILGKDWTAKWQSDKLGRATDGIWFNETERKYFRLNARGAWVHMLREDLRDCLIYKKGLSPVTDDFGKSEVGQAAFHIQETRSVLGVGALIYRPEGYYQDQQGNPFLNTCQTKLLEPASGAQVFGPSGNFPWLSRFFKAFIRDQGPDDHQFDHFMSNLHYAYSCAYNQAPQAGQVNFLAGGVGYGKTMMSTLILGDLFGGAERAERFITGRQKFNGHLFRKGLWVVDDSSGIDHSDRWRQTYTETIKSLAANGTFEAEEKFRGSLTVEWLGRCWITLNCDVASLHRLPSADVGGVADKINLYVVGDGEKPADVDPLMKGIFPADRTEFQRMVRNELPYFAKWLLDYEIPTYIPLHSRFGIRSYSAPWLKEQSKLSSDSAVFAELMDKFRDDYFKSHPDKTYWEGTTTDLLLQLHAGVYAPALRGIDSAKQLGGQLRGLCGLGYDIHKHDTRSSRGWRLSRKKEPSVPTTAELF